MQDRLERLAAQAREEIASVEDASRLEALRVRYLGKKGELSAVLGGMGKLAPEERRALGEVANRVKAELEGLLTSAAQRVELLQLQAELKGPRLDVTLAGRARRPGKRHPVSQTLEDIVSTFRRLGFELFQTPEIELDFYNFEALNFPKDHPARDMQDTFFVDGSWLRPDVLEKAPVLLRTHTSPGQVRAMLASPPPIRVVLPGRTYRRDSDQTHTPMFHQVEVFAVDKGVTFAELKGTLDAFVKALLGSQTKTRFRPSFFPFTEPSAEVDISCVMCGGSGCRTCKSTGWIEVLGAGMIHPNVFKSAGYDSSAVTGFAFGLGVERMTMLRYGIDDLRLMFENDARFLEQF